MMDLNKTIDLMCSDDYKERFIAEYMQTKIRYEKLKALNTKLEAAILLYSQGKEDTEDDAYLHVVGFIPTCPYELLKQQQSIMGEYLHTLELRAVIEGVDLNEY